MTKRKAQIALVPWYMTVIFGIGFGLYQVTGSYGPTHHGWEIWPVNSHHIFLPIFMLLFWCALGIAFGYIGLLLHEDAGFD